VDNRFKWRQAVWVFWIAASARLADNRFAISIARAFFADDAASGLAFFEPEEEHRLAMRWDTGSHWRHDRFEEFVNRDFNVSSELVAVEAARLKLHNEVIETGHFSVWNF
jgi:hypothetical protein